MGFEGEAPKEFARGTGYVVATWRNVLMIMWSGPITTDGLDASERGGKMLEREYKGEQIAISISLPSVPIPDDKARAQAARLMREREGLVRLSITVIEGDGFWLSAGRMVMTALVGLAGSKSKPVIAKTIDEAATHAHPYVSPKTTHAEVTRALRAFRG